METLVLQQAWLALQGVVLVTIGIECLLALVGLQILLNKRGYKYAKLST